MLARLQHRHPRLRVANVGGNRLFPPWGGQEIALKSGNRPGQEDLVTFLCNIHPWMHSHVWVFDHPYAAVTGEDGTYETADVPAGPGLNVVHWHESFDGPRAERLDLKEGKNRKDFRVKG